MLVFHVSYTYGWSDEEEKVIAQGNNYNLEKIDQRSLE